MIYFDSSALVKRYLKEDGTEVVKSILRAEKMIGTSKLTYPEMFSAFMRKFRTAEIGEKHLQSVIDTFETDWAHFFVIEFHDELLQRGKELIERYPLKAADAVHLSSALWLELTTKANLTFLTSDDTLVKAARAENLRVVNPLHGKVSSEG